MDVLADNKLQYEDRLQVVYRILKDHLRQAKKQLLMVKKRNQEDYAKAIQFKRRIEAANAKNEEGSIADQIKEVVLEEGSSAFKFIGSQRSLSPKLKGILNHLLNSDKGKHYKYCPCCRNYEAGDEPSGEQMGEFLEFIRQQFIKTHGKKKNQYKRIKQRDERLEGDSMSEITDLSNDGILSTSLQLLSKMEQDKIDKYNAQFRKTLSYTVPKHNCFADIPKQKKVNNSRFLIKMELRAKSEPKEFSDKDHSAHQFSVREQSAQADSEEREDIALQTSVIDMKSMNQQVDIYDLDQRRDKATQDEVPQEDGAAMAQVDVTHAGTSTSRFLKEKRDVGTITSQNRRFIVTQDWFFSKLFK